jgi:Polyphosphate kinase 2 (PPK2)
VLEGWDTAVKGGIVRRLGWALDPRIKAYPIAAPLSHERGRHYLQRFGKSYRTPGKSLFSTARGTGVSWSNGLRVLPASENGGEATKRSMNSNA